MYVAGVDLSLVVKQYSIWSRCESVLMNLLLLKARMFENICQLHDILSFLISYKLQCKELTYVKWVNIWTLFMWIPTPRVQYVSLSSAQCWFRLYLKRIDLWKEGSRSYFCFISLLCVHYNMHYNIHNSTRNIMHHMFHIYIPRILNFVLFC